MTGADSFVTNMWVAVLKKCRWRQIKMTVSDHHGQTDGRSDLTCSSNEFLLVVEKWLHSHDASVPQPGVAEFARMDEIQEQRERLSRFLLAETHGSMGFDMVVRVL